MSLPTRKIAGVAVTAMGYGTMGLSAAYGKPKPDAERLEVRRALSSVYELLLNPVSLMRSTCM